MNETAALRQCSTLELNTSLSAIAGKHLRQEEKEVLEEIGRRLTAYSQLNTGHVPPANDGNLSPHSLHIGQLNNAISFYGKVSKALDTHGLLDWKEPFDKIADGLSCAISFMNKRSIKLIALICEIYAAGGVMFDTIALPDEVEESVVAVLRKRGKLPLE